MAAAAAFPARRRPIPIASRAFPVSYENVDYVLINHGTNDRHEEYRQRFLDGYERLLQEVYKRHPHACVIVMVPFCGAFRESLQALVETWAAARPPYVVCGHRGLVARRAASSGSLRPPHSRRKAGGAAKRSSGFYLKKR